MFVSRGRGDGPSTEGPGNHSPAKHSRAMDSIADAAAKVVAPHSRINELKRLLPTGGFFLVVDAASGTSLFDSNQPGKDSEMLALTLLTTLGIADYNVNMQLLLDPVVTHKDFVASKVKQNKLIRPVAAPNPMLANTIIVKRGDCNLFTFQLLFYTELDFDDIEAPGPNKVRLQLQQLARDTPGSEFTQKKLEIEADFLFILDLMDPKKPQTKAQTEAQTKALNDYLEGLFSVFIAAARRGGKPSLSSIAKYFRKEVARHVETSLQPTLNVTFEESITLQKSIRLHIRSLERLLSNLGGELPVSSQGDLRKLQLATNKLVVGFRKECGKSKKNWKGKGSALDKLSREKLIISDLSLFQAQIDTLTSSAMPLAPSSFA